jgi:uncharacterized protein YutE (UPF0331/DUF86 family)
MTPLNTIQKTSIIKRIDSIETELKDLDEYKILDFNTYTRDRKVRRDVERIIENIVNATIDIGKIILAGEDIELPDTYREIFIKLGDSGLIDTRLAGCLSDLARLRNILAHQYLDIKWAMINDFISQGSKEVTTFLGITRNQGLQPV